jgi:hypothetical protein
MMHLEEDEKEFILSRIKFRKRNVILGGCFGILSTGIFALFPIFIWYNEFTKIPRIFSVAWWAENDIRATIMGCAILFGVSLIPLIPIIWFLRQIKSDLIEYRRLKKILHEYYG